MFVFPRTWQLCPEVICIPYSICKNSKHDGVDVTGYDVLPCFLTMSVERLPEGLSCFCIYGRLSTPVGQRNFDQTPLTDVGDFSFPNWEMPSYLQLTKIQKIRSTVVWWVSVDTISFITQRYKIDHLTKSIQNSSAHIL